MLWARTTPEQLEHVFVFTAGSKPAPSFSFPPLDVRVYDMTTSPSSFKRSRPLPDGGEGSCRKKRRLRLKLITSRLSRPFSSPSSHIIDRGASKIAIWAKQKCLGRNLLRKAAIMNRVRQQSAAAAAVRASDQRTLEAARQAFMYVSELAARQSRSCPDRMLNGGSRRQCQIVQIPRREYIPLPPSPLGLSNYDALDLEDEIHLEQHEEEHVVPTMYSDFSLLGPSEPVVSDYDDLDRLETPITNQPEGPVAIGDEDDTETEILHEREKHKQMAFEDFGRLNASSMLDYYRLFPTS